MNYNLEDIRKGINECDLKIIEAFKERMKLVHDVALYKKENNLPIFDKNREDELIKRNLEILNDESLEDFYLKVIEAILVASKQYQYKTILENEE